MKYRVVEVKEQKGAPLYYVEYKKWFRWRRYKESSPYYGRLYDKYFSSLAEAIVFINELTYEPKVKTTVVYEHTE